MCLLIVSLSLSIAAAGCFTQSYLARDQQPPDDASVIFHLRDSTHISSFPKKHLRIDEGYEVIGTITADNSFETRYEGIILDDDVAGIAVNKFNPGGTAALLVGASAVILLIITRWGKGGP